MNDHNENQKLLFRNLLKKMYEKGETEKDISPRDIIQDLKDELRTILAVK